MILFSAKFHRCFVNLLVFSFLKTYLLTIVWYFSQSFYSADIYSNASNSGTEQAPVFSFFCSKKRKNLSWFHFPPNGAHSRSDLHSEILSKVTCKSSNKLVLKKNKTRVCFLFFSFLVCMLGLTFLELFCAFLWAFIEFLHAKNYG